MFTIACLLLLEEFSDLAVMVKVPLFDPLSGDTDNQSATKVMVQLILEDIDTGSLEPEAEGSVTMVGSIVSIGSLPA